MQSILKDWHLAEPVRVVPCVHGEELPAVVGEGEDVDLVPADGHQSEDCIILQSEDSQYHPPITAHLHTATSLSLFIRTASTGSGHVNSNTWHNQ